MKLNEAIYEMKGSKTLTELASDIGHKPGALGTVLKRNNMQVKTLVALLESCDYELVIRPTKGLSKGERTYVIDEVGQ